MISRTRRYTLASVALAFSGAVAYYFGQPSNESLVTVLIASVSLAAIAVAFAGVGNAILLSLSDSRTIKRLSDADAHENLISLFSKTAKCGLFLVVLSSISGTVDLQNLGKGIAATAVGFWAFAASTTMLSLYRVVALLEMVLRRNAKDMRSGKSED